MTKRQDCAAITLANGSLTIMENECQHRYVHCVPREQEVSEGRINLTFRCKHEVCSHTCCMSGVSCRFNMYRRVCIGV